MYVMNLAQSQARTKPPYTLAISVIAVCTGTLAMIPGCDPHARQVFRELSTRESQQAAGRERQE